MIKSFKYILICACCILTVEGCSGDEVETLPSTSNDTLDSLLAGASFSYVDLDQVSIDTLIIEKENVLGYKSASTLTPPGFLGSVTGMITVGDSLYISDGSQKHIWVINSSGEIVRSIGRSGSGPGEFGLLQGITRNSDYVFATDGQLQRATVYDTTFNRQTYMELPISGAHQLVTTDSVIFLPAGVSESTNLIRSHEAYPPFEEVGTFFPRIIPQGMGPPIFNTYTVRSNSTPVNGVQHVTAYIAMPYLFFYDEHLQHIHTLVLQGSVYDELNNPLPVPQPLVAGSVFANLEAVGEGLRLPIVEMVLQEDGSLLLGVEEPFTLYHIIREGDNYEVLSAWRLAFEDPADGIIKSLDRIYRVFLDSNTLYLSRRQQPYAFRMNLTTAGQTN